MKLKLFGFGIIGILGTAGLIWLLNLPYPLIRRPVAKVAPILLLPSYLSMDYNYREAIANVEQADQLINQATSSADIQLGGEKTQLAQENLNALPVWFLGYEPQRVCSFFQCSWQFTIDEFEAARAKIGRMEAKIFQEKNALAELDKAEAAIQQSKQKYQQATNPASQKTVVDSWQTEIDQISQIPPETFAGKQAQTRLEGYERDFQEVVGVVSATQQTNTMISVAQEFALQAVKMCEKPPYKVNFWEKCQNLWQEAISKIEQIPSAHVGYLEAQKLLAQYKSNLATIEIRKENEANSTEILAEAQRKIDGLIASIPSDPKELNVNSTIAHLQSIINELKKVEAGTTVYSQAQELLKNANNKLNQLQ